MYYLRVMDYIDHQNFSFLAYFINWFVSFLFVYHFSLYGQYFLSLAVLLQSAITAPTNFLQPFETYFSSQPITRSSSDNLRSATSNSNVKVPRIQNRGGPFTKNYFEDFKIPDDFGNNFPEYSETPQSGKESGNSKTSQTERVHQKNEYYSYSFRYRITINNISYFTSIGGNNSNWINPALIIFSQHTGGRRLRRWRYCGS